jgi:hypothetical protein
MDERLKSFIGVTQRSAHEITFSNGSFLRVDTTLRGGTCQLVLVSEFGKTCARSPQKAEEIITGTLNTIPIDGKIIIESTGEGSDGFFVDMCTSAATRDQSEVLSPLEYKLFFFPWFQEKTYRLSSEVLYDTDMTDYFSKLEKEESITLSKEQKWWYAAKYKELGKRLGQEYPSTVSESFLSSSDAYYYADLIAKAHADSRILNMNPYDALAQTYVAMDIGVNDLTCIIFFQVSHGEIKIFDYYEDNKKSVDFYVNFILEKRYILKTVYLPHDSAKVDNIDVQNTYERDFRRLLSNTGAQVQVLKRSSIELGISHAQTKLSRCVFNGKRCKKLIESLAKYRKQWSESTGMYLDKPLHDIHSHSADAFRYTCAAVSLIENTSMVGVDIDKHRKLVENRQRMLM